MVFSGRSVESSRVKLPLAMKRMKRATMDLIALLYSLSHVIFHHLQFFIITFSIIIILRMNKQSVSFYQAWKIWSTINLTYDNNYYESLSISLSETDKYTKWNYLRSLLMEIARSYSLLCIYFTLFYILNSYWSGSQKNWRNYIHYRLFNLIKDCIFLS